MINQLDSIPPQEGKSIPQYLGEWSPNIEYRTDKQVGGVYVAYFWSPMVGYNGSIYIVNGTSEPIKGTPPSSDPAWRPFFSSGGGEVNEIINKTLPNPVIYGSPQELILTFVRTYSIIPSTVEVILNTNTQNLPIVVTEKAGSRTALGTTFIISSDFNSVDITDCQLNFYIQE